MDFSKQTADYTLSIVNLMNLLNSTSGESGTISDVRFGLIGKVKIKIDEMLPEGEGVQFEVQDLVNTTDNVDLLINAMLDECARYLHQTAPLYVLTAKASTASSTANADFSGYVPVPSDFVRLHSFKMSLWQREVSGRDLITPEHPKYKLQSNIYTRGGKAKPVCALNGRDVSGTYTRVIEYYSLADGDTHTIEKFLYIPSVLAENVQANLQDTLASICAWQVLLITHRNDQAKAVFENIELSYKNLI